MPPKKKKGGKKKKKKASGEFFSQIGVNMIMLKTISSFTQNGFNKSVKLNFIIYSVLSREGIYCLSVLHVSLLVDGELTIEDKYKKTMEEIAALKDHLG